MRKLVAGILVFLLVQPIPANAFFNRDCKNLAKRTATNQVKYEKAWNTYQKVLGDWINANSNDLGRLAVTSGPVANRFRQVGEKQLVIIRDFLKYPKCVTSPPSGGWGALSAEISRTMVNVVYTDLYFNYYFKSVFDYDRYVRK